MGYNMKRIAIIRPDNTVETVIMINDPSTYQVPKGYRKIEDLALKAEPNLQLSDINELSIPRAAIEEVITYTDLRRKAYPTIVEQLDMMYWDRVNGTGIWQATITDIKNRYPKPK